MAYDPNLPTATNERVDRQVISENFESKQVKFYERSNMISDHQLQRKPLNQYSIFEAGL
jgi:hypothetical protein